MKKSAYSATLQNKEKFILLRRYFACQNSGQAEEANRIIEQVFMPAAKKYQELVQQLLEAQRDI
jgi:hypothetical protein